MRLDMLIAHTRDERLVAVEQAELLEAAPQREVRARERDVRLERRGRGRDPCGWGPYAREVEGCVDELLEAL